MSVESELKRVIIPNDGITVRDFANRIDVNPSKLVRLLFLLGKVATCDSVINYEDAKCIADEYGFMCQTESDYIKQEACNNCKNRLKGILSDDELEEFVIAFMNATDGYTIKRKE